MMSLPPRPSITSGPGVPRRTLARFVPQTVQLPGLAPVGGVGGGGGGFGGAATVSVRFFVALPPAASFTRATKGDVPGAVGVPEMVPLVENASPAGRLPDWTLQV